MAAEIQWVSIRLKCLVPGEGIEPTRCHHHRILSPARLPVPPSGHARSRSICDRGHLVVLPGNAAHGFSFRPPEGAHCPAARDAAFGEPAAAALDGDGEDAARPAFQRFAGASDARPISWCSTIRGSCLPACMRPRRAAAGSNCCSSACSALASRAGACPRQQGAEAAGRGQAARRAHGAHARARRRVVSPRILGRRARVSSKRTAKFRCRRISAARPNRADRESYQTVYARAPGAVAAPTAGLHFDAAIFAALEKRGVRHAFVTLHVGAGTFQPVRVDDIERA